MTSLSRFPALSLCRQVLPPSTGRPIVAWAHPTTGVVPRCAPSLALFLYPADSGPARNGRSRLRRRRDRLSRAWYAGDASVSGRRQRSARRAGFGARCPAVDGGTQNRFAVWGTRRAVRRPCSRGLSPRAYASDLDLVGVAAAAPPPNSHAACRRYQYSGGRNLTAMTLWSWSRIFGAPIDRVLDPSAVPTSIASPTNASNRSTIFLQRRARAAPLEQHFLSVNNFYAIEPWRSLMAGNTPGPLPPNVPLLLAQGGADELVRPQVTEDYMQRQCRAGGKAQLLFLSAPITASSPATPPPPPFRLDDGPVCRVSRAKRLQPVVIGAACRQIHDTMHRGA